MQYKSLIISNLAETYYQTYRKSDPTEAEKLIQSDILESDRAVFYANNSKILITSLPLNHEFLEDVRRILSYEIINLYPHKYSESICKDILDDKTLLNQIQKIIRENPDIEIIPYYATSEFFELLTILKQNKLQFTTPETISPKNRFIRDHYNCKVGFRELWERATDKDSFVKIPPGFIVNDLKEALDAAWWFYQKNTNFVFKYNRGTSGFGIVPYNISNLPNNEIEFKKYLTEKHNDKMWFEENFVVEEFIETNTSVYDRSPSIEFKINGDLKHQYNCLQRLREDNYFEGIIISKKIENYFNFDINRVVDSCKRFGEALIEQGYRGNFDIDLIIDKKHNVYAVESNLRRTGGTHIFETATHLFGKNFQNKISVFSRDNLPVKKEINNYSVFKEKISHLLFSKEKGEGVIPSIVSFLAIGTIGYMILAKDLNRLEMIEKELFSVLTDPHE